ncbi:MAG: stage III sporulation protein SpoAB [Firmicutes bacterium ADurb.Bin182]|nr:MAG: stage III sporulation protein SpoAB [Firmicutes bacterium ADurb.Bin182]
MGKALLMICVFSCCTLTGLMVATKLRLRYDCLLGLLNSLRQLRAKMEYSALPLFEIVKRIGDARTSVLWDSFSLQLEKGDAVAEAWKRAVHDASSKEEMFGTLKEKESDALSDFISSLGKHDLATQRKAINVIELQLQECLDEAKSELSKKGKLYSSIGMLCGICGAILIW